MIILFSRIATLAICWQQRFHDHASCSRLAAAVVLLAPVRPAAASLSRRAAGRVTAGCDGGQADRARRHRPGRICRRFVAVDRRIRARVSGYLDQIHFRDGQMVKQGDLLFTIDKRPFQNAVDQARDAGAVQGHLGFAENDLERAKQLVRDRTITEQAFDQRTQVSAARPHRSPPTKRRSVRPSSILPHRVARARRRRIGDRRVSPGNLVTGGTGATTMLANIVSLDPVRFEFTMDEASYLRYERFLRQRQGSHRARRRRHCRAQAARRKEFRSSRHHGFVDNTIDVVRHDPRPRGVLEPQRGADPGMFGRIRVPGSPTYNALLLPDAAIGTEQIRKFVLVVGPDNTAVQKYVTLGPLSKTTFASSRMDSRRTTASSSMA